jgi:hypothetical protein
VSILISWERRAQGVDVASELRADLNLPAEGPHFGHVRLTQTGKQLLADAQQAELPRMLPLTSIITMSWMGCGLSKSVSGGRPLRAN